MSNNDLKLGNRAIVDNDGNYVFAFGDTIPTGHNGYALGCVFVDTQHGDRLINNGTTSSAAWVNVLGVKDYATASARDTAYPAPDRALMVYNKAINAVQAYDVDAAFWRTLGGRVCWDLGADIWLNAAHGVNVAAETDVAAWVDQSGNAYELTETTDANKPHFAPSGVERPYLAFDGTDDNLSIAKASFANDLSALTVIVRGSYPSNADGYVIGRYDGPGSDRSWGIKVKEDHWTISISDDGTLNPDHSYIYEGNDVRGTGIVTLAITFGTDGLRLYEDGAEITPTTVKDSDFTTMNDSAVELAIGNVASGGHVECDLYQVAVFNSALTPNQIKAVYTEWAYHALWSGL